MAQERLNIVLLGRKDWSKKAVQYLIEQEHNVLAVVGRQPSDLVSYAEEIGIATPDPKELYSWFNNPSESPIAINEIDLVVSYLFWQKVKEPLLSTPKIGAINFHPAPLPDYRGLGGYNAAILDNREEYGVTSHFMNQDIDAGDIIKVRTFPMDKDRETAYSLEAKSQEEMFLLFKETIERIAFNDYEENLTPNTESEGVYINKQQFEEMKIIKDTDSQEIIERKIRAFWYPPYEGAKVRIGDGYYTVVSSQILSDISIALDG